MSRDPLQCSELVLCLQASLEPDEEVEIIMDRRRAREVFDTEPEISGRPSVDRRNKPDVDLAVRTKGFAIVPAPPMMSRSPEEPDADDRSRFENILSFERRHESRPGRVVDAARAAIAALILTPPLNSLPERGPQDIPSSTILTKAESSGPALRLSRAEPTGAPRPVAVGEPASLAPASEAK